jgi:diguanylate cyclase (GGDEF)-like protein
MWLITRLQGWMVRLSAQRYRRLIVAAAITLFTSVTLLGLIGFIHWRGAQAVQTDTRTVLTQTGQQLVRAFHSRRGTLTFLRDTLNRQSDLTPAQLQAMGKSAVSHTRHLLGVGLVQSGQPAAWWSPPYGLSAGEVDQVGRAIGQRTRLRGIWKVPSTFTAETGSRRVLLIMLEPLSTAAYRESAIVGVFNVKSLLEDFLSANLSQRYPVRVLDGETMLYQSDDWAPAEDPRAPLIAEHRIAVDAARWTLQMQPGSTPVAQTLSWLNILVVGLSLIAGTGVTIIVWILAARTWILQRAVNRRTAALRRASERLRQLATTDELTGLYNRRFFLNRWAWECERAKRYARPLACLMIDVNGFKQVNDRLGHQAGDTLLKQVAQELKTVLRYSDVLARFGGDEFVVALPETTPEQAAAVAEKLREIAIQIPEGRSSGLPPISLSVGMSRIQEADESPQDVLEAADQSLYAHKRRRSPPHGKTRHASDILK